MPGSANYSGALDTTDKVELVRIAIGDTVEGDFLFTDKEIEGYLSLNNNIVTYTGAALMEAHANKLSRKIDKAIGKTKLSLSQAVQSYREGADRLRSGGPGDIPGGDGTGVLSVDIMVGGITRAEKDELATDTVFEPFSFEIGQDDHPGSFTARDDDRDD